MNNNYCTHEYVVGDMDLTQTVRILRTLDEKYQQQIAGLAGSKILLRCKDDEAYMKWVKAWKELAG